MKKEVSVKLVQLIEAQKKVSMSPDRMHAVANANLANIYDAQIAPVLEKFSSAYGPLDDENPVYYHVATFLEQAFVYLRDIMGSTDRTDKHLGHVKQAAAAVIYCIRQDFKPGDSAVVDQFVQVFNAHYAFLEEYKALTDETIDELMKYDAVYHLNDDSAFADNFKA